MESNYDLNKRTPNDDSGDVELTNFVSSEFGLSDYDESTRFEYNYNLMINSIENIFTNNKINKNLN